MPFEELESSLDTRLDGVLFNHQPGKQFSAIHTQTGDVRKRNSTVQEDLTRKEALESRQVQQLKLGDSNKFVSGGVATLMEEKVWGSLRGLRMDDVYFQEFDESDTEFKPAREQLSNAEMIPHVFSLKSRIRPEPHSSPWLWTCNLSNLHVQVRFCIGQG